MEAVILCGGKGLRMNRFAALPKTLADIDGKPVIWHIMNLFSRFGVCDFILPLGYKGRLIKEYFNDYHINHSDYNLSLGDNRIEFLNELRQDWNITFVETGTDTETGLRLKMVEKYIKGDTFFVTYGDGIADIDIGKLLEYHRKMDRMATITGVEYRSHYGILTVKNGAATTFREKPLLNLIINGGFMVMNRIALSYLNDKKNAALESTLLKKLAALDELAVYKHDGYWIGIDTYKDLLSAQSNFRKWSKNKGPRGE